MKSIEETYQKKSQLEHVLHRPGMYIGDTDLVRTERFVIENSSNSIKFIKKILTYSPGLYKIFDEIFTNATDHSQRDSTLKKIEIFIDLPTGRITIRNDGAGIPIEIHKEFSKYVPDIIFGEFHTSSNYDDTEKRTVGGLNGYGAKLTNAFSKEFEVSINNNTTKQHYKQTWFNNMSKTSGPIISKNIKGENFTQISFIPDYARFQMEKIDNDLIELIKSRVYDGAGITNKKVNIYFQDNLIPVKDFSEYISLFVKNNLIFHEKINNRWEIAFAYNDCYDKFTQMSFVNGISTSEGGTHVDYVVNQVVNKLKDQLEKKYKDITIKPSYIKDNIIVFINCLIENPTFSSQTKESHVTKVSKFGSKCELTDDQIKKIDKLGITSNVIDIAKAKDSKNLNKTDGKKQLKIMGIPKLDDANKAGGSEGWKCKLILTEGDSAKASAVAGLSVVGRDYYGVFPLRGKLLNVRDATPAQLLKNEETNNLKKILGLQQGKEYTKLSDLRYGGILIFTDADNDGSHIKGLIINFIHTFWPSLMKFDSFISSIITPIVKVTKGKTVLSFYNQIDFAKWKDSQANVNSFKIKYYKGLGTSTSVEAKEYFTNLPKQTVKYSYDHSTDNEELIKAFKKGYEDSRKDWIKESVGKGLFIDHKNLNVSIKDFINKDLINFSIADLERSIPNLMDGFKPSQRKVLYGCLKRNLYNEIKVAQLSGYISEHTSYHHGEVSLQGTIVNMAQDFVGSNNINLLEPIGQFGTRINSGKDAGSPRYIFTKLNTITKILFNENDNVLLDYLDDDGVSIEPKYYIPIIPMLLVNGSEGIGTGYSTNIPCYNPADIIQNLKKLIKDPDAELTEMIPWYRNFKGTIIKESSNKYITYGTWERQNNNIIITELPIGKSTQNYKEFLDTLLENNEIIDYKNCSDDSIVNFKISLQKCVIDELISKSMIEKTFKLTSVINTSNMHVFDTECKIAKMSCPEEIIYHFYKKRTAHFQKRKKYLINKLTSESELLESKIKFINYVINEKIVVFNKKKDYIISEIKKMGDMIQVNDSWDYLLDLKIWTFTEEKINQLNNSLNDLLASLKKIKKTSIEEMWTSELNQLN